MKIMKDLSYGIHDANKLDLYIPDTSNPPVVVYFHGGGIESGDKEMQFAEDLAKLGVATISANYRMFPEAKYPDFIYDAAAVVKWTADNIGTYIPSYNGIYVSGSSAGGYLSMMLCFCKDFLASVGMSNADIAGYYHDAGQPTAHFNVLNYAGLDPRRVIIDDTAPIYYINDTDYYPPMEIAVSDNDMENRYEQTMLMISTLKHFGRDMNQITLNILKNSTHCQYCNEADNQTGLIKLSHMICNFVKRTQGD